MVKNLGIQEIKLSELRPNGWNPNELHPIVLNKLKESIKAFGFSQPLWVRKKSIRKPIGELNPNNPEDGVLEVDQGFFEIIGGEQRYKAALAIGLESVPCYVFEANDFEAREMTLVENQLKGEHNPIKEKDVLRFLLKERSPEELELLLTNKLEEMSALLASVGATKHVEFEAKEVSDLPLILRLTYSGDKKHLMSEAMNMTGKKLEEEAIFEMAIFYRKNYGR
jgi:hypothetical protein